MNTAFQLFASSRIHIQAGTASYDRRLNFTVQDGRFFRLGQAARMPLWSGFDRSHKSHVSLSAAENWLLLQPD